MKVLFDQGTPVPLRRHLRLHEVTTAYELAWTTLRNGDLIAQAEAAARTYAHVIRATGLTVEDAVKLFRTVASPTARPT